MKRHNGPLPGLLIISVIAKRMFTAAFFHSFASVEDFNTVVYIVYPQPSGLDWLHFKPPYTQSIADNQLTHLFHLLHKHNFQFCSFSSRSSFNFVFWIRHSSPRIVFSSRTTSGPHDRSWYTLPSLPSPTPSSSQESQCASSTTMITARIFSSTTTTISTRMFTSSASCTFAG